MISDQDKTREQLIAELNELRRKVNPVPQAESACGHAETRQIQEILMENEEHFRFIADYTHDWENWVGCDGRLFWVNPAVERITGYSREEYSNMPDRLKQIIFDDDQERILSHFENGIKYNKSGNDVEFRIRCKDGSLKWVSVSYQPIYTDGGKCLGLRSSIRDITERKAVESALMESEAQYRELVESANSVILRFDPQGRITFFNAFAERLFGYSREEIVGKSSINRIVAEVDSSGRNLAAMIDDLVKYPERYAINENENIRKDGSRLWIAWTNKALHDAQRNTYEVLCIGHDITAQKIAERALRESEEKYRTLLNDATDAILLADAEGTIFEANRQAEALLGYTAQEFAGINFAALHPERERDRVIALITEALLPQGTWSLNDVCLLHKDGTLVPADISGRFIEYAGKRVILGIVRNISERKAAAAELDTYRQHLEELVEIRTTELSAINLQLQQEIEERNITEDALRRSEEQFRTVIETASDAIVTVDSSGNIVFWNREAEHIFGYTAEEILNRPFFNLIPECMRESHRQKLSAFLAQGKPGTLVTRGELSGVRKDGSEFPTEGSASLWKTSDGTFITTTVRDITERRKAVQALRESEEKFRTMAEQITASIFIYQQTKLVYANPAALKLSGYPFEELFNMRFWNIIHPDFKKQADEWDRMQQAGEDLPSHFELKIQTKNGGERWIDYTAAIINYNGLEAVLGTAMDITERKLAENALRQSEERYRLTAEHAPFHLGASDQSYTFVLWNKYSEKMFGYTQDEVINKLHPSALHESPAEARAIADTAMQEGIFDGQLNMKRSNGSLFPAHLVVVPNKDERNNVVGLYGFAEDITQRKRAEDLINKVNDCLLSFSADPDSNIQSIVETAGTVFDGAGASYFKKQADSVHMAMTWNLPARYRNLRPINAQIFDKLFASDADQPLIFNRHNILPVVTKDSAMLQMGFESFIATPVKLRNTFVGSLSVAFNSSKAFSPNELNIFSILGKAIAIEEDRKKVLEDLKQHQLKLKNSEKSLKAFSGRILSIREEEKKNISSALHDEIGSMVIAVSSGLAIAKEDIIENSLDPALKSIERTETALKQAVDNLKKIAIDLRPPSLDIVGLSNALKNFFLDIARQTNIAIDFSAEVVDKKIDDVAAIVLYRTAQEALNNIFKHAKAKAVSIRLHEEKRNILFEIADNGRGFNPESLTASSSAATKIGIQGMRERIASLGGILDIESGPQKGTTLHITIPKRRGKKP